MNTGLKHEAPTKPELIEEYSTLTGSSKGSARSLLMYACSQEDTRRSGERGSFELSARPEPKLQPDVDTEDRYGC
jgi:hypothetical protein